MSDTKNIYQRINAVMKEVEYVQKDAVVSGAGSYKAVTHDMVVAVVRDSMVKHGIVVRLEQLRGVFEQKRDVKNDIKVHLYAADFAVHFVNIDKPDDSCAVTITAHANDSGDKAPGKAASYAVKYAMLKTFSIETGENDESRTYEAPAFTELQKSEFDTILDRKAAIDYAVFTRKVGPDVMMGLQKTFADGQISQKKKLCKELESEGWNMLRDYADQIGAATDKDDTTSLIQLADELTPDSKRVLAGILRPEDISALRQANEAA